MILQWVEVNGGHQRLDSEILALVEQESERTTKEYEMACVRIRRQREANKSVHPIAEKACSG